MTNVLGGFSRIVPTEVEVVWRAARQPRRKRLQRVKEGFRPVEGGGRSPRRLGPVCAVAVVRNEEDVIGDVLNHLAGQDVDSIVVADNRSDDATLEILQEWSKVFPTRVFEQTVEGHYQAETITTLSKWAAKAGARWIIPFDADEFWFAESRTLGIELRHSAVPIRSAQIHNLFPVAPPDASGYYEFRLDLTPHVRAKVAFKSTQFLFVLQGNHRVERRGATSPGLHVAHLPWRSLKQVARKVRLGREAYEATDLDLSRGYHKRFLGALDDQALAGVWQTILAGRPIAGIEWSPVGPLTAPVDVRRFSSWSDLERDLALRC